MTNVATLFPPVHSELNIDSSAGPLMTEAIKPLFDKLLEIISREIVARLIVYSHSMLDQGI